MKQPRILVYVEARRGYYARYHERQRTHKFLLEEGNVEPYWIEMLRNAPETWDHPEPEAA